MAMKRCMLRGGQGPLTKEHLWPQWFSRERPSATFGAESRFWRDGEATRLRKTSDIDWQARVLCTSCNSIWGEGLESAVRPRLTSMAGGQAEIITLPFARHLAPWATLKIMVGEYIGRVQGLPSFF